MQGPAGGRKLWHNMRNEKLAPESDMTVLGYSWMMLQLKRLGNIRDNAFDRQVRALASIHNFREGCHYPPSLFAMKAVIGVEPILDFERHVCANDCADHGFVHIAGGKKLWRAHAEDSCASCGEKRFETYRTAKGEQLRPKKVRLHNGHWVTEGRLGTLESRYMMCFGRVVGHVLVIEGHPEKEFFGLVKADFSRS